MSTHGEKRTRPFARMLDGIGHGVGCAAGIVALLLLWTYDVSSRMRGGPGGA